MRVALREIRRARARFGLLTGAVGLLAFLILFQQTLLDSLVTQFVGALRNQSADVLVFGDQARRNVEGSFVTVEQAEAVAAVRGVADSGLVGQGTFTVTAGDELRDAVLFGYELGGPGAPTTLTKGRLPERDGEAVASRTDAPDGFDIGDVVVIEPDGPRIEIVGLGRDLRYSVAPTLFTSYATYEAATLAANPDAVAVAPSLVAVEAEPGTDPEELAAGITAEVDGVEALDRDTAASESPGVQAVQSSFGVVLLLGYLVVALVTGFFFLILTVQKSASLTLLRAIGAPRRTLVGGLLVQVVLVLAGGLVVATALLALAAALASSGLDFGVSPSLVVTTGSVLLVLAVAASLGAIRRVLRIDPIEATRTGGLA